ncbi:DedA family protein [Naasia lichenicola]|uniref:DedA family protein n=1 Tax=Naasia lichenicola TaxID=2565933 RepID=A0A4S4FQI2_9MICO|nr:VTT domain-containing protein [Naasia lichenicola]THG30638.1 DedA family protein [Naasia lichenicola]THG31875.1 DedA family protein [Naasia lichenicola]
MIRGILDPQSIIESSGPWGLLVVCAIIFVETGLLIGFVLPGDTLLFFTGVLTFSGVLDVPLPVVIGAVIVSAVLGDQLGYLIGHRAGPAVFERKQAGLISKASLERTNAFFAKYGARTVTIARFVPVVRTIAPVAAGAARMHYRRFLIYNIVGGAAWTLLIIVAGYFLGQIPGVADFVSSYIDIILIGIVVLSVGSLAINLLRQRRKRSTS